jgi:hypothetical protein
MALINERPDDAKPAPAIAQVPRGMAKLSGHTISSRSPACRMNAAAKNSVKCPIPIDARVGAVLPYSPLAAALGFVPLPPLYWGLLLLTLACYVGLTQLVKMWLIRKAWV